MTKNLPVHCVSFARTPTKALPLQMSCVPATFRDAGWRSDFVIFCSELPRKRSAKFALKWFSGCCSTRTRHSQPSWTKPASPVVLHFLNCTAALWRNARQLSELAIFQRSLTRGLVRATKGWKTFASQSFRGIALRPRRDPLQMWRLITAASLQGVALNTLPPQDFPPPRPSLKCIESCPFC